jgi:hypothetical protein
VLAFLFLFVSGANAASMSDIQQQINHAGFGDIITVDPGTYQGYLEVNQTVILLGIDNPVLTNSSTGAVIVNITSPQAIVAGFTITGFNVPGSTDQTGIRIDNHSPDMTGAIVAYNSIINNGKGLVEALLRKQCGDNSEDCAVDASPNFWGPNGAGSNRGKPGEHPGDANNGVVESIANVHVTTTPWLTANVTDVAIMSYINQDTVSEPVLENPDAGVDVDLTCTGQDGGCMGPAWTLGSALYNNSPYAPNLPGDAIKFVNVFVKGCSEGMATVTIYYDDADGVVEDTLTPYVLKGSVWIPASDIVRTPGMVSGSFPVDLLNGSPIALVGNSYTFTIDPAEDPSKSINTNPVLTISINSSAEIGKVYYQLDHHASTGWKLIADAGLTNEWTTEWNLPSADWANLTNGSHTYYFKFERQGKPSVGTNGQLKWQFFKGSVTPPSLVQVIRPNSNDVLTRSPFQIEWTLPSQDNIDTIKLWFARNGDFNMYGGLNNPILIASLSGGTTYTWVSPNIRTDTAKIAVVVTYIGGTQYVGISDNFSIAKGYSFHSYKPVPKPPWQIGSGISRAVAILGSWFKKPHIPYVIG